MMIKMSLPEPMYNALRDLETELGYSVAHLRRVYNKNKPPFDMDEIDSIVFKRCAHYTKLLNETISDIGGLGFDLSKVL